jgi:hypothetical protein
MALGASTAGGFSFEIQGGRGENKASVVNNHQRGAQAGGAADADAGIAQQFDRANLAIAHAHHALVEIQANGEHFRPQPATRLDHRQCLVRLNARRSVAN